MWLIMSTTTTLKNIEMTIQEAATTLGLQPHEIRRFVEYGVLHPRISTTHGRGRRRIFTGADLVRIRALLILGEANCVPRSSKWMKRWFRIPDAEFLDAERLVITMERQLHRTAAKVGKKGALIGTGYVGDKTPPEDFSPCSVSIAVDLVRIRATIEAVLAE
jgi:hypothetical protein